MNLNRSQNIALFVSCTLGAGSGPFLFKAAGFQDFPDIHRLSHYIIIICYVTGAMTIARLVTLRLLSLFTRTAKAENEAK